MLLSAESREKAGHIATRIEYHLAQGYGVEDIALKLGWHKCTGQELVRQYVRYLRASGRIREVLFGWGVPARRDAL